MGRDSDHVVWLYDFPVTQHVLENAMRRGRPIGLQWNIQFERNLFWILQSAKMNKTNLLLLELNFEQMSRSQDLHTSDLKACSKCIKPNISHILRKSFVILCIFENRVVLFSLFRKSQKKHSWIILLCEIKCKNHESHNIDTWSQRSAAHHNRNARKHV